MKPVWIVDDDRSIRWVIEKALSREGIAFDSFSTAQEALDALSGGAPEVLRGAGGDGRWGLLVLVAACVLVYASVFRLAFAFDLVFQENGEIVPPFAVPSAAIGAIAVPAAIGPRTRSSASASR